MFVSFIIIFFLLACDTERKKKVKMLKTESTEILSKAMIKLSIDGVFTPDQAKQIKNDYTKIFNDSAELGYQYAIHIKNIAYDLEYRDRYTRSSQQKTNKEQLTNTKKSEILKFRIIEKKDISYLNNPRMVYRIILDVNSLPTDKDMRNTAISIWENGNKNWKEFTTFLYLPEMNTGMTAYGIGEFNERGLIIFRKNENALFGTKWDSR